MGSLLMLWVVKESMRMKGWEDEERRAGGRREGRKKESRIVDMQLHGLSMGMGAVQRNAAVLLVVGEGRLLAQVKQACCGEARTLGNNCWHLGVRIGPIARQQGHSCTSVPCPSVSPV